jgi:hypothetical protein
MRAMQTGQAIICAFFVSIVVSCGSTGGIGEDSPDVCAQAMAHFASCVPRTETVEAPRCGAPKRAGLASYWP